MSFKSISLPSILILFFTLFISQVGLRVQASEAGILEIKGSIDKFNSGDHFVFDRATLESLGGKTMKTHTPWTDDQMDFEGVLLKDLLKFVGAKGGEVVAVGLDDYSVTLPADMISQYPIMIAYKKNGKYMTVREMGPLWIVFPYDDYPELNNRRNNFYWVWQLSRLEIR